jgi:hypothetical protein
VNIRSATTPEVPAADPGRLDRDFAVAWYESWIRAWNEHDFEGVKQIVTDDFLLDSPTTRHTGWVVRGPQATSDYLRYVLGAYPDLRWEVTAAPLFRDEERTAAFCWRGTGHFTGRLDPPGIDGTGRPFEFAGYEVFSFRGEQACHLDAAYDLVGLTKQTGVYRR